jgi:hypothetical protein
VPEEEPIPPSTFSIDPPLMPSDYGSPQVVEEHKAQLAKMEGELEFERKLRREADGEIIKLRASLNGVDLKHEEIEALQKAQQLNPCFL